MKNMDELTLLIAVIPPAGPIFKLKVKMTLAILINTPAQVPMPKLKRSNSFFKFQYTTQNTIKIRLTIENLRNDC